jgi:hypothetical protein
VFSAVAAGVQPVAAPLFLDEAVRVALLHNRSLTRAALAVDKAEAELAGGANPPPRSDKGPSVAHRPRLSRLSSKRRNYKHQQISYIDIMTLLLDMGADPNARLATKVWYGGNLSGVNEQGATAFWRAAYASDLVAMKLLVERGADPNIPTMKGLSRPMTDDGVREYKEVGNRPATKVGGRARRRWWLRPGSATARPLPATPTTRADGDDGGHAQRRRARRRGSDSVPAVQGRGPEGRQPRGEDDGDMANGRCSGFSRGRRRWRCWRSWGR